MNRPDIVTVSTPQVDVFKSLFDLIRGYEIDYQLTIFSKVNFIVFFKMDCPKNWPTPLAHAIAAHTHRDTKKL